MEKALCGKSSASKSNLDHDRGQHGAHEIRIGPMAGMAPSGRADEPLDWSSLEHENPLQPHTVGIPHLELNSRSRPGALLVCPVVNDLPHI